MKILSILAIAASLLVPAAVEAAVNKGVVGSDHDFSKTNYLAFNTRRGVCTPCHTAHATDPAQIAPLFAHKTSTGPFTMYSSPTIKHTPGTVPDGASLACLSCHDGTIGVNSPIQGTQGGISTNTPVFVQPNHKVGPDLHTDHPISFVYDAALAAASGELENPVT